jgi:hypothetical protein
VSTDKAGPTKGPWDFDSGFNTGTHSDTPYADIFSGETIIAEFNNFIPEGQANARLIADAGTTYHATGKTPSELAAEVERLQEHLRHMLVLVDRAQYGSSIWIRPQNRSRDARNFAAEQNDCQRADIKSARAAANPTKATT